MPFIYKPFRQTMSPNNTTINPAISNKFNTVINGQICSGYRFRVFDMNNVLVSGASTNLIVLGSPIYDGDLLEVSVGASVLSAGSQYKWLVDLYSSFLTVSSINTANDTINVVNHNLLTGDSIFMQSSGTFPTGYDFQYDWVTATDYVIGDKVKYSVNGNYYSCKLAHTSSGSILPTNTTYWDVISTVSLSAYEKYYIRVKDKDNLYLFKNLEGARNNQGVFNLITAGTGTITISNVSTSDEIAFNVYNIPTITLTVGEITAQSTTFAPVYSHPQGVLINKFQAFLYDSTNTLIDNSNVIYSSNIKYTFDGFLSGSSYGVRFIATNNVGQEIDTGVIVFSVLYSSPSLIIKASAENICKDSCIKVSWGNLIQIVGSATGTYDYIEGYLTLVDYGLDLDIGSTLSYEDIIMENGSDLPTFIWQPKNISFTGIIAEFTNSVTSSFVKIYYDGTRFYQDRDGVIINGLPFPIVQNEAYLISIIGFDLFVKSIATYVV